jgi:transcription factor SPT20
MPQPTGELELSDEMRAQKLPQVPKNTQAVSRRQDDGSQEQTRTSQQQKFQSHLAYQAHQAYLACAQLEQMRMAQLQQSQPRQGEMLRNSPHMIAQLMAQKFRQQRQQQMVLIAGQPPDVQSWRRMQNMVKEPSFETTWRYAEIYQQRLVRLKHDMLVRLLPQYGPPTDWPQVAQEYTVGLEQAAMGFAENVMRQDWIGITAAQQLLMLRQSSDKK